MQNDLEHHLSVAFVRMGQMKRRRPTGKPKPLPTTPAPWLSVAMHFAKSLKGFDMHRDGLIYRPGDVVNEIAETLGLLPDDVYHKARRNDEDSKSLIVDTAAAMLRDRFNLTKLDAVGVPRTGGMHHSHAYDFEAMIVARHGADWRERHVRKVHPLPQLGTDPGDV